MVAEGGDKDLRLVLETAKGIAVDDAVAVTLEAGAYRVQRFRALPPFGEKASHGTGRESVLPLLGKTADVQLFNH
jgi:hypothetical protein